MANKMLIDASHPEETRVVVLRGNRVEEFDFESASKKQLRGNIYLAKVTRVEPSLQAAFVDYGGNRHGFLAFSEIHPDYYQIPVADRQALIEEEARAHRDEEEDAAARSAAAAATAGAHARTPGRETARRGATLSETIMRRSRTPAKTSGTREVSKRPGRGGGKRRARHCDASSRATRQPRGSLPKARARRVRRAPAAARTPASAGGLDPGSRTA